MSDFTPFVWLNPDPGNRVANLVEVTGFTMGDGGYLRFPRKFDGVEFRWKNFHRLLLENADPSAHEGHHFVAHHKDECRWNNVLSNLAFFFRSPWCLCWSSFCGLALVVLCVVSLSRLCCFLFCARCRLYARAVVFVFALGAVSCCCFTFVVLGFVFWSRLCRLGFVSSSRLCRRWFCVLVSPLSSLVLCSGLAFWCPRLAFVVLGFVSLSRLCRPWFWPSAWPCKPWHGRASASAKTERLHAR